MFSVTLPIAEKSDPAYVIRTRTSVPAGKGVLVLTKHPARLRSRVTTIMSSRESKSITSAIAPKSYRVIWRRSSNRFLGRRGRGLSVHGQFGAFRGFTEWYLSL